MLPQRSLSAKDKLPPIRDRKGSLPKCSTLCNANKVETEDHFLLECTFYKDDRKPFLDALFQTFPLLKNHSPKQLFIWLMSCEDANICKNVAKLVTECFMKRRCKQASSN